MVSLAMSYSLISLSLRTTVPSVSYIRISLRFWYYASLSTCCQNLEKNWGHGKVSEKAGLKLLRDLTERKVSILVLWQLPTSGFCYFWWRKSKNEISLIGEKKIHGQQRKTLENDIFFMKQSPFLSPNFIQGSTVIVIPHNVQLYKQYFLQEYSLLSRKSCNWFSVIAFMKKTTVEIKTCRKGRNINFYCK